MRCLVNILLKVFGNIDRIIFRNFEEVEMRRVFKLPVKVGKEVGEQIAVLIDPDKLFIFFLLFAGCLLYRFP